MFICTEIHFDMFTYIDIHDPLPDRHGHVNIITSSSMASLDKENKNITTEMFLAFCQFNFTTTLSGN